MSGYGRLQTLVMCLGELLALVRMWEISGNIMWNIVSPT